MLLSRLEEALDVKFEKEVVIGAEMEIYLIDAYGDEYTLLNEEDVIEDIYSEFDERVYRDYYEYQLEIRTNPSEDWKEVADELIELMKEVSKVAREKECIIAPVSYIKGGMFCGFHVHVSYKPEMSFGRMVEHALAMYPFVLDITRITLSAPFKSERYGEVLSLRQLESPHIGTLPLHYDNTEYEDYWIYDEEANLSHRYHDIIINTNRKEGRHRIKSVDTIEIRMFDCVGYKKAIYCVLESVYSIAKYVNPEWFNKYRHNYSLMLRIRDLINNSRIMLVNPNDWINPLTLIKLDELLSYLNVENRIVSPWIYHVYWDCYDATYPETHAKYRYPVS